MDSSDAGDADEIAQMEKDRAERYVAVTGANTQEAREHEALAELRAIRKGIEALVAAQEDVSL